MITVTACVYFCECICAVCVCLGLHVGVSMCYSYYSDCVQRANYLRCVMAIRPGY